jgi:adenosine deaminase
MAKLIRHGVPVVLSTDDPAMFHTTLSGEYQRAREMGLTEKELEEVVVQGFAYSFAGKEKRVGRVRERN